MHRQSPYFVTQHEFYQQFTESNFWRGELSAAVDDALQRIADCVAVDECLSDLSDLQDSVFCQLIGPLDYADALIGLYQTISDRQEQETKPHVQLPGHAGAVDRKYQYYDALKSAIRTLADSFTREYTQWQPVTTISNAVKHFKALINAATLDAEDKYLLSFVDTLQDVLQDIPRIYRYELTLADWYHQFETIWHQPIVIKHQALHAYYLELKPFIAAKLQPWLDHFTYLEAPAANQSAIKNDESKTNYNLLPIVKTLGTVALLTQQFTAAAATNDGVEKQKSVSVPKVMQMQSDGAGELGILAANLRMNQASQAVGIDSTLSTPPEPDNVRKHLQEALQRSIASRDYHINNELIKLAKDLPQAAADMPHVISNLTQMIFGVQVKEASMALGFMPAPRQVFKHLVLNDSEKLAEDSYLFAKNASSVVFDQQTIPADLLDQLHRDLFVNRDSNGLISALQSYDDKALFKVAYQYAVGTPSLGKNVVLALRWAHLAMERGNVWAAVYISETIQQSGWHHLADDALLALLQIPRTLSESSPFFHLRVQNHALVCLHFAAYHGHPHASILLAEGYRDGKFGPDSKLAQAYFVQAMLQFPSMLYMQSGLVELTMQRITGHFPAGIVPTLSWQHFHGSNYVALHQSIQHDCAILGATMKMSNKILGSRQSEEQRKVATESASPSVEQMKRFILRFRYQLHQASDLLEKFTLEIDQRLVLLPSIAELEAFGLQCRNWSTSSTEGYLEQLLTAEPCADTLLKLRQQSHAGVSKASLRIAEMYAGGLAVKQNAVLAELFYQQALQQEPDMNIKSDIESKISAYHFQRVRQIARRARNLYVGDRVFDDIQMKLQLGQETQDNMGLQWAPRPVFPSSMTAKDQRSFFLPSAIRQPRALPSEMLHALQHDLERMPDSAHKAELRQSLSAMRDGDYTNTIIIANHYYHVDVQQALQWYIFAADHGHVLGMYMAGQLYLKGRQVGHTKIDRDVKKGFDYTLNAARAGFALASHELAALSLKDDHYANLYLEQASKQDPDNPENGRYRFQNATSLELAVRAQGIAPPHVSLRHIAIAPVERSFNHKLVNELWDYLGKHHPQPDVVAQWKRDFLAGNKECFLKIAKWYENNLQQVTEKIYPEGFILSWALLGYRDGHLPSAVYFAEKAAVITDIHIQVPTSIMLMTTDTFLKLDERRKKFFDNHNGLPIASLLKDIAQDALYYAAYYGNYQASEKLAEQIGDCKNCIKTLFQHRAVTAQAIAQGSHKIKILMQFVNLTTHFTRLNYDRLLTAQGFDVRELVGIVVQAQHVLRDMDIVCQYIDNQLGDSVRGIPDAAKLATLKSYFNENKRQINLLQELAEPSILRYAREGGVQLPFSNRHAFVADHIMRERADWEWQDVIPELVDPYFRCEEQPRAKTYELFATHPHPVFSKLVRTILTDPEDMLELHEVLSKEGETALADEWLRHAAKSGDIIANRILGLKTNDKRLLALASAHGDLVATHHMLNRSDTRKEIRPLLIAQAQRNNIKSRRKQFVDAHRLRPETSWLDYINRVGLIVSTATAIGSSVLRFIIRRRRQALVQQIREEIPKKEEWIHNIEKQMRLLELLPGVEIKLSETKYRIEVLPDVAGVTYKAPSCRPCKLLSNEVTELQSLQDRVIHSLDVIYGKHKAHDKLTLLCLRQKQQLLTYTGVATTGPVALNQTLRIKLAEQFVQLMGFNNIVIQENQLYITFKTELVLSPLHAFMCRLLVANSLRITNELQLNRLEEDRFAAECRRRIANAEDFILGINVQECEKQINQLKADVEEKHKFIVVHGTDHKEVNKHVRMAKEGLYKCDDALKLLGCIQQPRSVDANVGFADKLRKALHDVNPENEPFNSINLLYHRLFKSVARAERKHQAAAVPISRISCSKPVVVENTSVCEAVVEPVAPRKASREVPAIVAVEELPLLTKCYREMVLLLQHEKLMEDALECVRYRALHYRFLRLHKLLSIDANPTCASFGRKMAQGLLVNYFSVTNNALTNCINEFYIDKEINAALCQNVQDKSYLFPEICPDAFELATVRDERDLIEDLQHELSGLLTLHIFHEGLDEIPDIRHAYLDGCRMTILKLAEVGTRMTVITPFMDEILKETNHAEFRPMWAYICSCMQLRGNIATTAESDLLTLVKQGIDLLLNQEDKIEAFRAFCTEQLRPQVSRLNRWLQ